MAKYTWNDIVQIRDGATVDAPRYRERSWIVGVFEDDRGEGFEEYPPGVVYTVEFEDGSSINVHELDLESYGDEKDT